MPEWVRYPAAMWFNTFYIEPGDYYDGGYQSDYELYGVTVYVTEDTTVTAIYNYQK